MRSQQHDTAEWLILLGLAALLVLGSCVKRLQSFQEQEPAKPAAVMGEGVRLG